MPTKAELQAENAKLQGLVDGHQKLLDDIGESLNITIQEFEWTGYAPDLRDSLMENLPKALKDLIKVEYVVEIVAKFTGERGDLEDEEVEEWLRAAIRRDPPCLLPEGSTDRDISLTITVDRLEG